MNPIILIPSRLQSTRLPNKPLALILGKPMILRVWEQAVKSKIGPVVVACCSESIKNIIEDAGGRAILTDPDHPSGTDRIHEALTIVDSKGTHDTIIGLQGDLPTIDPQMIHEILVPFKKMPNIDMSTLAAKVVCERDAQDPNSPKVVIAFEGEEDFGRALYFSRATIPYGDGILYHHIGLYGYTRKALDRFVSLRPSPLEKRERLEQLRALENGMTIGIKVVKSIPQGVDVADDIHKAEQHLKIVQ